MIKWRLDAGQIEVVDDVMAGVLRKKSVTERVEMMFALNRTMRQLIDAGVRRLHPDWTDLQVQREIARRMSGGAS